MKNFKFRDNSESTPTKFNELLKLFPVMEFQLTQIGLEEIRVEVEFLPTCDARTDELRAIQEYFERELGDRASIDVSQTRFDRHGKFQRYRTVL